METKITYNEKNGLFIATNKNGLFVADADYCRLFGVLIDDYNIKFEDIII